MKSLCHVWLFETPRTAAHQAPLSQARVLEWVAIAFSNYDKERQKMGKIE